MDLIHGGWSTKAADVGKIAPHLVLERNGASTAAGESRPFDSEPGYLGASNAPEADGSPALR